MEERQIQDFVHRISTDEALRREVATDLKSVMMREGFSPRVARVIERLTPHLTMEHSAEKPSFSWWLF